MIMVIHFSKNKDPDIYFGIDEKTETRILKVLKKDWAICRCSSDEWPQQDVPTYPVHHWTAMKRIT